MRFRSVPAAAAALMVLLAACSGGSPASADGGVRVEVSQFVSELA